jgi:hypothetical protein
MGAGPESDILAGTDVEKDKRKERGESVESPINESKGTQNQKSKNQSKNSTRSIVQHKNIAKGLFSQVRMN